MPRKTQTWTILSRIVVFAGEAILANTNINEFVFHQQPNGFGRMSISRYYIMMVMGRHIIMIKESCATNIYKKFVFTKQILGKIFCFCKKYFYVPIFMGFSQEIVGLDKPFKLASAKDM